MAKTGATVKRVSSTSNIWWSGGVASTDVSALVNCSVKDEENPIVKFGQKLWMRERNMRKVAELEQGTPEWHKQRLTGIGGTEASALVGESYRNTLHPNKIWDEKVGLVAVESIENEHMKRGKRLEPVARELYETLYGWKCPPLNVLHDDYDYVRASLDGIRADDKLICEIKCMQTKNHSKVLALQDITDPLERQIQLAYDFPYYRVQMLYQLLITNADVCHFIAFSEDITDHRKLAVVEVYPEPENQAILLNRVKEFWKFVEDREPPPLEWCIFKFPSPENLKISGAATA